MNALELRLTYKYVGSYQHEDEWKSVGNFEVIQSEKWVKSTEEATEPTFTEYWVAVYPNEGVTSEDISRALKDSFTQVGCHHEYDCCGCRSFYAGTPKYLSSYGEGGQEWKVTVNSYRNY